MLEKPIQTRDLLAETSAFQQALIDWFVENGRELPWRWTSDPYAVLVSEIMCQQTQIGTVVEKDYYGRWLARFPDVGSLSAAPEEDVLKQWEGLGYYNRARNLQKAASTVLTEHGGTFPESLEEIHALPGVGRYTAGAVVSFAFNRPAPLVDGNVARVFSRLFDLRDPIDTTRSQKQLWNWAETLLPKENAREYNSALMEIGQRCCTKGTPDCLGCPVSAFCATRDPGSLPRKKPPRETVHVIENALFLVRDHRLLLEQETGSRRKGLWRLPLISEKTAENLPILLKSKYAITHHRVDLIVHAPVPPGECLESTGVREDSRHRWFDIDSELPEVAMPSPFRRAVEQALKIQSDGQAFSLEP